MNSIRDFKHMLVSYNFPQITISAILDVHIYVCHVLVSSSYSNYHLFIN